MSWDTGGMSSGLQAAGDAAHRRAVAGLTAAAEHILDESSRLVPIEEGTLQRSGTTQVDAANLRAAIGYGLGTAAPYAVIQHEDMTLRHDAGRQAKYLEEPLMGERAAVGRIIADHMKAG